jgi:PAS domain S-box-containing protein
MLRILLIEDKPLKASLIEQLRVIRGQTLEDANTLLQDREVDAVVLSLQQPDCKAELAIAQLSATQPGLPIVIILAESDREWLRHFNLIWSDRLFDSNLAAQNPIAIAVVNVARDRMIEAYEFTQTPDRHQARRLSLTASNLVPLLETIVARPDRSSEPFQQLFNALPTPLLVQHEPSQHCLCNAAFRNLLGCSYKNGLQALLSASENQISLKDTSGNLRYFNIRTTLFNSDWHIYLLDERTTDLAKEAAFQYRLDFEQLITDISSQFINLQDREIDRGIRAALQAIGEFAQVDRSYVFQLNAEGTQVSNTHEWCARGIHPHLEQLQNISVQRFGSLMERLKQLEVVHIPYRATDIESAADALLSRSLQSIVYVPMAYRGKLLGFVGFDAVRRQTEWTQDSIALLRIVGEIFAQALERKRVEVELRESEERFRQLAEGVSSVFWMTNATKTKMLYVSPTYEVIWGCARADIYQDIKAFLNTVHPDDRQRLMAASEHLVRRLARGGDSEYSEEYRIIRPDGQVRWIYDRAFPIRDENGNIYRITGIAEDISDRKTLERLKDEFLSAISHELRTPMTAIQGALKLLQTGKIGELHPQGLRMLEIALKNTKRLSNLIDDIFDFQHLEAQPKGLCFERCELVVLIENAIANVPNGGTTAPNRHQRGNRRRFDLGLGGSGLFAQSPGKFTG